MDDGRRSGDGEEVAMEEWMEEVSMEVLVHVPMLHSNHQELLSDGHVC